MASEQYGAANLNSFNTTLPNKKINHYREAALAPVNDPQPAPISYQLQPSLPISVSFEENRRVILFSYLNKFPEPADLYPQL